MEVSHFLMCDTFYVSVSIFGLCVVLLLLGSVPLYIYPRFFMFFDLLASFGKSKSRKVEKLLKLLINYNYVTRLTSEYEWGVVCKVLAFI